MKEGLGVDRLAIKILEVAILETFVQDILLQGYAIIDNFLSAQEVLNLSTTLLAFYEKGKFKKAGIGNQTQLQIVSEIRGDYICWLEKDTLQICNDLYFNKIDQVMDYLNSTCYLGITEIEAHFAVFPQGTHYRRHLDRFQNSDNKNSGNTSNDKSRKLSIICYLNPIWETENGGELAMYLPDIDGCEQIVKILPQGGRFICFESHKIPHEVLIAHKDRYSLTGWLL
jgi:SM-20-related protein